MRKILNSTAGMTLIEILVAMALMSVLTYYISTTIQNGARTKIKIEKDIKDNSAVRDALRVIEADINRAFNYRDINIQLYNESMKEREKRIQEAKAKETEPSTADPAVPSNPESTADTPQTAGTEEPFEPKEEKILTAFWGDDNEVHFTSLNNVRTIAEKKESSQMEVGYYVESCRGRLNKKKQSNCLWRRKSHILDDDVKEGGDKTVLLENVTKFELRYLGPVEGEKAEWDSGWQSDGAQDAAKKNHFPMAVEVTLEVQDKGEGKNKKKSKKTGMTMVAQIRNPNNPKPKTEEGQPGEN